MIAGAAALPAQQGAALAELANKSAVATALVVIIEFDLINDLTALLQLNEDLPFTIHDKENILHIINSGNRCSSRVGCCDHFRW